MSIPMLVLSPIGGLLADRLDRRKLLLSTQVIMGITTLAIAILAATGLINMVHLAMSAFIMGSIFGVNMPARSALMSQLVPREDLANAVGIHSSTMNASRIVGPALAGGLIGLIGIAGTYFAQVLGYVWSTALLTRLQPPESRGRANGAVVSDLRAGFAYVIRNRPVLGMMVLALAPAVFTMPSTMLLPAFVKHDLAAGPQLLGILMSALGVGGLAGSLVVVVFSPPRAQGPRPGGRRAGLWTPDHRPRSHAVSMGRCVRTGGGGLLLRHLHGYEPDDPPVGGAQRFTGPGDVDLDAELGPHAAGASPALRRRREPGRARVDVHRGRLGCADGHPRAFVEDRTLEHGAGSRAAGSLGITPSSRASFQAPPDRMNYGLARLLGLQVIWAQRVDRQQGAILKLPGRGPSIADAVAQGELQPVVAVPRLAQVVAHDRGGSERKMVIQIRAEQPAVRQQGQLGVDLAVVEKVTRLGPRAPAIPAFHEHNVAR